MSRELLILRHGKSDWSTGVEDFRRPITDRGKRAAQRMGVWLAEQDLVPDYIVSSPAERAITTTQKAIKAMGGHSSDIHRERRIYAAGLGSLLAVLEACPASAQRVLLVGHNPGLEELLEHLVGDIDGLSEDGKLLPTATLAHVVMPDVWTRAKLYQGCAQLQSLTRPKSLQKKFPFPGPGAAEMRDRPAYYYTQSSVIPYRKGKDGPEILVIASSQNKHGVVPKGIKEPGMTPVESAAKEAWEEAGIEGEVDARELGEYRYEKWGAECTVHVYSMKVTREIPEQEWEESHRGREWMSPKKAARRLKQKELLPLMDVLLERLKKQG